jgi:hypothetical protein
MVGRGGGDDPIQYYFAVDGVPAGEAPLEIREQWVGLALPVRHDRYVEGPDPLVGRGVETFTRNHHSDGVVVLSQDAIGSLRRGERDGAAAYWDVRLGRLGFPALLFNVSEGRLLPVQVAHLLFPDLD